MCGTWTNAMEYRGELNIALDGSQEIGDLNDRWEQFKDPDNKVSKEYNMKVNTKNTKITCISR